MTDACDSETIWLTALTHSTDSPDSSLAPFSHGHYFIARYLDALPSDWADACFSPYGSFAKLWFFFGCYGGFFFSRTRLARKSTLIRSYITHTTGVLVPPRQLKSGVNLDPFQIDCHAALFARRILVPTRTAHRPQFLQDYISTSGRHKALI